MTLACLLQLCMMCLADAGRRCTVSSLCILEAVCGSQMMLAYSKMGRNSVVQARCLVLRGHVRMFLWRKTEVVFALCAVSLMRVFQFRVLWVWIPRYLAVLVVWRLWLCMV